jgi:ribosomal protein S18 acetylase RimI-like enzyme
VQQKKYNDLNYFKNHFSQFINNPNYLILILVHESKVNVGCMVCEIKQGLSDRRKYVDIFEFIVQPKYRKLKGADFLYNSFEKEMQMREVFSIKVHCEIKSTLNQNFYTSKGFKFDKKMYLKNY